MPTLDKLRQTWCPQSRAPVTAAKNDIAAGLPAINRLPSGVPEGCHCLGPTCGAWRWTSERDKLGHHERSVSFKPDSTAYEAARQARYEAPTEASHAKVLEEYKRLRDGLRDWRPDISEGWTLLRKEVFIDEDGEGDTRYVAYLGRPIPDEQRHGYCGLAGQGIAA